jgi:hypothetical protein
LVVCSNYGNVILSYSLEADVTFTSTHENDSESNALRCVYVGGAILKFGFAVGFVHKRAKKSEFMCVCTEVRLLVSVCW